MAPDLAGKRLEILKEAFPKVSRVGHLWERGSSPGAAHFKEVEAAGRALRVRVQALEVPGPNDLPGAFQSARVARADSLIVVGFGFLNSHRERIVNLATKHRLPAMYTTTPYVVVGGLMSYAPDGSDRMRRAAVYVDKILKGTKPTDLPVQQPMKFEFVVNLKTATQIGLTISPNVLARADRVIR